MSLQIRICYESFGQKCMVSELQPFEKENFDLGHPVGQVRIGSLDCQYEIIDLVNVGNFS